MFKKRLENARWREFESFTYFLYKALSLYAAIIALSVFLSSCTGMTNKYVDDNTYIGYWSIIHSGGFGNERINSAFRKIR